MSGYRIYRSSSPEKLLGKGVRKIWIKLTGEHRYRSGISIKLQRNFIEITIRQRCSPVNLLHIFRTPFPKNTSGGLLLEFSCDIGFITMNKLSIPNSLTILPSQVMLDVTPSCLLSLL